jgi:phosphonate C-P lyase system protein PhnH
LKSAHSFDLVHDAQEVFRLFLEALANPGRLLSLNGSGFPRYGQWLAPALTLLDNETGFFWDGEPEIGEEIRFLSGCLPAALEEADFVFLSRPEDPGRILAKVKRGTLADPHDSALLLVAVSGKPQYAARLEGPGVPPQGRDISLCAAELSWLKTRDHQGFEYPLGVELVFLREDFSIAAFPRKVNVVWHT